MSQHLRAWTLSSVLLMTISWTAGSVAAATHEEDVRWQPEKTRVFIVCLARFQGEKEPSFTTDDRLDGELVELFRERGVPASQIVFLKDKKATTRNIQKGFTDFLRQSRPGEMLIFYFGSHGGYDPETGKRWFVTFDGTLPFTWAFEAIERDFRGSQALLAADCCYSGGIVELARQRKSSISYACLSSTAPNQIAWSGWRFMECLMRGLEGNPVVDLDGNGCVDLDELARYSESYMSFAAEGKPMFTTTHGFNPHLRLANVHRQKKDPRIGQLVEVLSEGQWYKAEILNVKGQRLKVHYTSDTTTENDEWVQPDQVRAFRFPHFRNGARVEVEDTDTEQWLPATVLESWGSLHWCRFDGRSSAYDEWVGPSRIRSRR